MVVLTVDIFSQACADKLKREIEEFGFPPKFPESGEKDETKQVREIMILIKIILLVIKSKWLWLFIRSIENNF